MPPLGARDDVIIGGVLAAASAGSEDLAAAHVVATAVEGGRSVVLTGDPDDIERLVTPRTRAIVVQTRITTTVLQRFQKKRSDGTQQSCQWNTQVLPWVEP